MSDWVITVTFSKMITGEVVEELAPKSFASRREAESFLLNHPDWINRKQDVYPTAWLRNETFGSFFLDPTLYRLLHDNSRLGNK